VTTNNGAIWFATPDMKKVSTGGEGEHHGGPAPRGRAERRVSRFVLLAQRRVSRFALGDSQHPTEG
jgi:hypothetical protein